MASSALATTCAARARFMSSVAFGFEQLGVREDDPELVVQAVEEETQFGRFVHRSPRQQFLDAERDAASGLVPSFGLPHRLHGRAIGCRCGSRHSVSTKMRTEPPAVRTYSILPLESQL